MKKFLFLNLIFLLLLSCGFTPMYSANKKINFYIENISFDDGDIELSNLIRSNLNNYLKTNNGRKFTIETSIDYTKNSISKNSAGNTEEYELISITNFIILYDNMSKSLQIKETSRMKNFDDEFSELEYEKNLKRNMAQSISSRLIMQLSIIYAN